MEWEAVTKGTYQIVITSHAAYSGMDKCGSCVQLHRWSECVLQIEKVLNYFVFEQTNGRKINDDCQRKLSLYFLMDGGWFSARREIVFFVFVFDKQNDAEQNLLLHYPIFAQIDCTLLLTFMPFYFTEGHCDLIVFFCTVHKSQGWGFFNNCRILPLKYEQS